MPSFESIFRDLHIPWPDADEGDLRTAASVWHNLAETIRDNYGLANSTALGLTSNNAGAAIDAFEKYWARFGGGKGALPAAALACDAMSTACASYADAVAEMKHKIEAAIAEVAATMVVGTLGSFFTFGATEGIADSVATGLLATAAAYLGELSAAVAGIVVDFSATIGWALASAGDAAAGALASDAAAGIGSSVVSGALTGVGGTVISVAAENAVLGLFGEQTVSSSALAQDLLVSGLAGGATGGLLGHLGNLSATQLSKVLTSAADSVAQTDPQQFVTLTTLAKQLDGTTGKVSVGVLSSVATQLIMSQQINAESIVSGQLKGILMRAAEGGAHAVHRG